MSAIAGSDRNNCRNDVGLFGTGSSLASDVVEVLRSPRDYVAVKRALAEAGYKGEKIVVMAPTDVIELGNRCCQVNLSRSEKAEAGYAITLPPPHSAIRSPPRIGRSAALIARRDGVEG
jgi:hypothetical protein